MQASVAQLTQEFREFRELMLKNLPEPEPEPEVEWLPLSESIRGEIMKGKELNSDVFYRIIRNAEAFPKKSKYKAGIHFKRVNFTRIWVSSEFWKLYYGDITP